jgi:hypothetical protein
MKPAAAYPRGFEPAESIANSYASLSSPQFVTTVVTTTLRYCATNPPATTSECKWCSSC